MSRLLLVCLLSLGLPVAAEAAVFFSEVAWMGSQDSPNHEWIELYNDGAAVDVTDWEVLVDEQVLVTLEGILAGNSYAVLERTSEASAPGTAFTLYTGALKNNGKLTLALRSPAGLIDQLNVGENWQNIGGDNITKDTAQYNGSKWITAPASAGLATPVGATSTPPPESDIITVPNVPAVASGNERSSSRAGALTPELLVLPPVTLGLTIDAPARTFRHHPTEFVVTPRGIGPTLLNSLQYQWNFGDGETATGKEVTYRYTSPGTYVVTVFGSYKRQEFLARQTVTVVPVVISLSQTSAGDVHIHNDAVYEIDISNYRLTGKRSITLPPYTFILPHQTITIPAAKLGGITDTISFHDTTGLAVASINLNERIGLRDIDAMSSSSPTLPILTTMTPPVETYTASVHSASAAPPPSTPVVPSTEINAVESVSPVRTNRFVFASDVPVTAASATATSDSVTTIVTTATDQSLLNSTHQPVALTAAAAATQNSTHWWFVALVGLLTIAIIALYVRPHDGRT